MVNISLNSTQLFGLRLRDARQKSALSQKDVAERIGVAQPTISTWERGEATPRKRQLGKLIALFDLVGESGKWDDSDRLHTPSFGEWMKQTRKAKGLSVLKLAEKAKISSVALYCLQNGKTENPHPQTVRALTKALGTNLDGSL